MEENDCNATLLENELFEGLKVSVLDDGLQVVEPDVLVDISTIAACFQDYGHHPLAHLINRLKPMSNTAPILLGNFAGTALDQIIHDPAADFGDMLRTSFSEQALQFCTCEDFNPAKFKTDALRQVNNIREAVDVLFDEYDRDKALLEPSFVCKALGLRGRVDLMTSDMRLLVEQKSGKKWVGFREAHYVQVLLYYGVLRHNFQLDADSVDIRLLYSKYPASQGLLDVANNDTLFREAIHLRNLIVALEMKIAREGFASVLPLLQPDVLLQRQEKSEFFHRYVRPEIERTLLPLRSLAAPELDYMERMVTFVFREQFAQRLAQDTDDELRRGDMVYYYRKDGDPDLCHHILNKGMIERIDDDEITVWSNDNRQDTPETLSKEHYAIEPASTDATTTAALRSLMAFCGASPQKRHLLMGTQPPRQDPTLQLSRSYHPAYDDILLHAKQARDYFLLQGPPGTGKTSMALRFLVEETLANSQQPTANSLLLTAYTHRAVDEICAMLEDSGQDYLRLGSETSCDPRFAHRLLSSAFSERPKLSDIRQRLERVPIVVSTTLTLLTRPFLLSMKHFSLCIVDEASQILEPYIVGLLSSDSIDRFILIGDHKQLPAVVAQADDEPQLHGCRLSLFERLLRQEREAGRQAFVGLLQHQGRMHPDIAAFPNAFFYRHEQLQPVPCPHQLETDLDYGEPSEDALDDQLKRHRVLFLPADDEASVVVDVLRRLYRQIGSERFDAARSIGIIVTYRHQIAQIHRKLVLLGFPQLEAITIDTVERYQGSQRDVIIYSTGVQDQDGLDFLTSNCFEEDGHTIDRKLNVAMTRARKQLIITGQEALLRKNAIFSELIAHYSI
jgi:hypothetical protein